MNLQNPKKFQMMVDQAHEVALNVLRLFRVSMTKPNLPTLKS